MRFTVYNIPTIKHNEMCFFFLILCWCKTVHNDKNSSFTSYSYTRMTVMKYSSRFSLHCATSISPEVTAVIGRDRQNPWLIHQSTVYLSLTIVSGGRLKER